MLPQRITEVKYTYAFNQDPLRNKDMNKISDTLRLGIWGITKLTKYSFNRLSVDRFAVE
jgi:hypothetical protein